MRELFKRLFAPLESRDPDRGTNVRELHLAACALLVEAGRIDETFSKEEVSRIVAILKEKYGLSPADADAMMADAQRELEESVDLWQFAHLINENYTVEEKIELVEMLWRVVYVDGRMDAHEHYLMNKVKNLLRLEHRQLIAAKQKVLHGANK